MSGFHPVLLVSDFLLYLMLICVIGSIFYIKNSDPLHMAWKRVISYPSGFVSLLVLSLFTLVTLLDSIHFIDANSQIDSVLDALLSPLGEQTEKTYSKPFAINLYNKEFVLQNDGTQARIFPHLVYAGKNITTIGTAYYQDILTRVLQGTILAFGLWAILVSVLVLFLAYRHDLSFRAMFSAIIQGKTFIPWRAGCLTFFIIIFLICIGAFLSEQYHILGTDKVGIDVLYESIKSIRTGFLIGTLTTLVMLPFAVFLGTMAGYFGGKLDDAIQYTYTTLSSIPGVLLIAASVLSIQIYIDNHSSSFQTFEVRADARLVALCVILGVTSWTSLCRVLRAETLKIRELDYIQAAKILGTNWLAILMRHIIPNVFHIILMTVVLDFSGLVLAEAVLTYVGVGVDPTTYSWGNLINSARLELAREPAVWWPLASAFGFLFVFVLSANLFADAVRNGFDPRVVS